MTAEAVLLLDAPTMPIVVRAVPVARTGLTHYSAWEELPGVVAGVGYTEVIFDEDAGRLLGKVGAGPLPRWVDDLPSYSVERREAYLAWRRQEAMRARAAIFMAVPELAFDLNLRLIGLGEAYGTEETR